MEDILQITGLIALISFIILAICAIVGIFYTLGFFKELKIKVSDLTRDVNDIKMKAVTSLEKIDTVADSVNKTLENVDELKDKAIETMGVVDETIADLKETSVSIRSNSQNINALFKPFSNLSKYVYERVAPPIVDVANYFSAITKAVSTFTSFLGKIRK